MITARTWCLGWKETSRPRKTTTTTWRSPWGGRGGPRVTTTTTATATATATAATTAKATATTTAKAWILGPWWPRATTTWGPLWGGSRRSRPRLTPTNRPRSTGDGLPRGLEARQARD